MMNLPNSYQIPVGELAAHSPIPLTILPDLGALNQHFARAIADEIAANNAADRPTRLILPVGPVGHFPILAQICVREQIAWRNVHAFFMDEYCDWQGRLIAADHPLSFRGFAQRALFDQLPPAWPSRPPSFTFPTRRTLTGSAPTWRPSAALMRAMAASASTATLRLTSRPSAVGLR
ncbi:MAG: hypothetical protein R2911_20620 [Caldilineaceae bacterium]